MRELNVPSGGGEAAAGEVPVIPGYTLLRQIGRGSYGEVWLAQSSQGEYHAVKVVYRHTFERDKPYEREFSGIQKFEPVSRAEPSQVAILKVGRDDAAGFFYYVMDLADDQLSGQEIDPATYKPKTLRSEVAHRGRVPYKEALEISLSLTKALEHLHRHGLIHRDIKPSNIIFVRGAARLADIGLVTDVGASISYVGTEGFLPPEGPVSQQADIYSLGKVLYEISTGQDRLDFPELPTFLGDPEEKEGLLELNLIFLKACQNDPQKRYRTANEMYADLLLLRSGKSLKKTRALERQLTRITRAFAATAAVGILIAAAYYAINQHRVKKLRADIARAQHERQIADDAARDTRSLLVGVYRENAARLEREGDVSGALAWHAKALLEDDDAAKRAALREQIVRLASRLPPIITHITHTGAIQSARLSIDGTRVVTAGSNKTARVWDVISGKLLGKPLQHKAGVLSAQLSPDNQRVLTVCDDGTAWLWKISGNDTIAYELGDGTAIHAAEFSPNARFALTRGADKRVVIWDGLSGRKRLALDHKEVPVVARYSPDGNYIAVAAGSVLYIWDSERGDTIAQGASEHGPIDDFVFSGDGRRMLAMSGRVARLCNPANGEWSLHAVEEASAITSASFSADGRSLLLGCEDGSVRVYNTVTGKPAAESRRISGPVRQIAVSGDGVLFAASSASALHILDSSTGSFSRPAVIRDSEIVNSHFSSSGQLLLTAVRNGIVFLSDFSAEPAETAQRLNTFSTEELISMAALCSGRAVNEGGGLSGLSPSQLAGAWHSLTNKHADFAILKPAIWHERQGEKFMREQSWFAANFHASRLLDLNPESVRAREWHATARRNLDVQDAVPVVAKTIPARSPETPSNLLDLTANYNASLTETWFPAKFIGQENDLSELPSGLQKFNGVRFDVRGLIQLTGTAVENLGGNFPRAVNGISVGQKCHKLHFLQGAGWEALYGTVIGKYVIHYADGERAEAKLVFGKNVRDWWFPPTQGQLTMEAAVAWQGANPAARHMGMAVRVYQYVWINPRQEVEIATIDFVSAMEKPAPFLLAITLEQRN